MTKIGNAQWVCKKCKGKFDTMVEFEYHKCEPVKFKRPEKRPRRTPLVKADNG